MVATGIHFQESLILFLYNNNLSLTKEMQNVWSNRGCFFHLFIKRDKFIELTWIQRFLPAFNGLLTQGGWVGGGCQIKELEKNIVNFLNCGSF